MLDEFAFMMRTKVQIIFFNFHVLEIFSAKCCNFSMYLCYHALLDCLAGLGCNTMLIVKFTKKIALFV